MSLWLNDNIFLVSFEGLKIVSQALHNINMFSFRGTPKSDMTARQSLSYILPRLDHKEEAEESWENLDTKSVGKGAQALRWLVWVCPQCPYHLCLNLLFSSRLHRRERNLTAKVAMRIRKSKP